MKLGSISMVATLGALAFNLSLIHPAKAASWVTNSPLAVARYGHTATVLPNGKVLVAGGYSNGVRLSSVELYDPANGKSSTTSALITGRADHTASLLQNGKCLAV